MKCFLNGQSLECKFEDIDFKNKTYNMAMTLSDHKKVQLISFECLNAE